MNYISKKEEELNKLYKKAINDETLPLRGSNLVFGEGSVNCDVMFIGEAPGKREDELVRPFVGRSGKLLDELIKSLGWKREDVYITNIVKRRPPENRDPLPEEIEKYKPYLTEQIHIIDPPIIATLGRFSMNYFLKNAKISRDQGKVFKIKNKFIVPLFHPAAALRSPSMRDALVKNFNKLPAIIKKYKSMDFSEMNKYKKTKTLI